MNEWKYRIKYILLVFAIIYVSFILQSSVFSSFKLAGVTPNILLIITSFFGFMRGRKEGIAVGFFCGLILDLFMDSYFGAFALIYLSIGFLNGFFKRLFFGDDIKLPMFLVFISDLVYGIFIYIPFFLFRGETDFLFYFANIMIPEAVYTVLVAILLYFVMIKINPLLDRKEDRGDINFAR